jgi:hypothetical protein
MSGARRIWGRLNVTRQFTTLAVDPRLTVLANGFDSHQIVERFSIAACFPTSIGTASVCGLPMGQSVGKSIDMPAPHALINLLSGWQGETGHTNHVHITLGAGWSLVERKVSE